MNKTRMWVVVLAVGIAIGSLLSGEGQIAAGGGLLLLLLVLACPLMMIFMMRAGGHSESKKDNGQHCEDLLDRLELPSLGIKQRYSDVGLCSFCRTAELARRYRVLKDVIRDSASGWVDSPGRLMSKRLKTFIMQTFVFAALILTGLGVQANQVVPAEHVQLQVHSMNVDGAVSGGCGEMAHLSSAAVDDESPSMDCDMDPADCHSSCANCPASNDQAPAVMGAASSARIPSEALAVIAAQYPIDHPPKHVSSL